MWTSRCHFAAWKTEQMNLSELPSAEQKKHFVSFVKKMKGWKSALFSSLSLKNTSNYQEYWCNQQPHQINKVCSCLRMIRETLTVSYQASNCRTCWLLMKTTETHLTHTVDTDMYTVIITKMSSVWSPSFLLPLNSPVSFYFWYFMLRGRVFFSFFKQLKESKRSKVTGLKPAGVINRKSTWSSWHL